MTDVELVVVFRRAISSGGRLSRLANLPQAVRIIVPVVTIQYVSIVKASSLGIAIGYPELFGVISTTINITGHAVEGMVVLMAGYLLLTLSTAGAMNLVNARLRRHGAP